jgi:hypothetical protein
VPLLLVPVVVLLVVVAVIALMPLSLVLRYRRGTARQMARGWVTALNVTALAVSTGLFLLTAAVTSVWVPRAFTYSLAGWAGGALLGWISLRLSRWETTSESLHYTPNRWLVLAIMLAVLSRIVYGFWRAWHVWRVGPGDTSWLAASGAAGSLAVGALVLGYYLAYWLGVRRRLKRHMA